MPVHERLVESECSADTAGEATYVKMTSSGSFRLRSAQLKTRISSPALMQPVIHPLSVSSPPFERNVNQRFPPTGGLGYLLLST